LSKTGAGVKSHTGQNNDLTLEKKGYGKNLRKKSGILPGVSARDKTKKRRKHRGFGRSSRRGFGDECHIFGVI